jgi:hypothetical protein
VPVGGAYIIGERERSSNKELITIYALRYDLASQIGVGMQLPIFLRAKDFCSCPSVHPFAVFAVFETLEAISKLLNPRTEEVQEAIGSSGANCPMSALQKWEGATGPMNTFTLPRNKKT